MSACRQKIEHDIVRPAVVSPRLTVPSNIKTPEYYESGVPKRYISKKPEIKTEEAIEKMKAVCKLTRFVLDSVVREVEVK